MYYNSEVITDPTQPTRNKGACNMNAFLSFDLFMVYIPEDKQQLKTMK